jgi:hypothetical protein
MLYREAAGGGRQRGGTNNGRVEERRDRELRVFHPGEFL